MQNKHLILITDRFPFGLGETFLETELPYLARVFEKISLFPSKTENTQRPLPANVSLDTTLAQIIKRQPQSKTQNLIRGLPIVLTTPAWYRQVLRKPAYYLNFKGLKRLSLWASSIRHIRDNIKPYLKEKGLDQTNSVFYSYWLNLSAMAFAQSIFHGKMVSRAHGFDLYDERNEKPYASWKCLALKNIHQLFLISENGRVYIQKHYPEYFHKCNVAKLGVSDQQINSKMSSELELNVVSAASLRPVKRINLLIAALLILSKKLPQIKINWNHFGDGPLMRELVRQINDEKRNNLIAHLHGMVPNSEVMAHYQNHPVDVYINVSSSEGIPVSIMEAQVAGIPIIATAVGGTPEIVNNENGWLLEPGVTPQFLAHLLADITTNKDKLHEKKQASRESWNRNYNAQRNYTAFAQTLLNL